MQKKPVLSYELFLEYGGEGGLTRFARPFGQSSRRLVVCPTGCAATQPIPGPRPFGARASSVQKRSRRFCVEPRSVVLTPPVGWLYVKKKPVLSYELFLEYGGEGGIDSLRSPFGQSPRKLVVCPTGCASCRTPVGCSHPPCRVALCEKKARTFVRALS